MKKLLLSAFADEYASGFEEQLRALCRLGIDFIELRFVDGKNFSALSREELAYVKELLSRYGVRPSAIGSPIGKIRLDEDVEAHLSLAERVFSYAEELGAKFVRIFSFYAPEGEDIADHEEVWRRSSSGRCWRVMNGRIISMSAAVVLRLKCSRMMYAGGSIRWLPT